MKWIKLLYIYPHLFTDSSVRIMLMLLYLLSLWNLSPGSGLVIYFQYLIAYLLQDYNFLFYSPSLVSSAASALVLQSMILDLG